MRTAENGAVITLYAVWKLDTGSLGINVTIEPVQSDIGGISYSPSGNQITFYAPSYYSSYMWLVDDEISDETSYRLSLEKTTLRKGVHSVTVIVDDKYSASYLVIIK